MKDEADKIKNLKTELLKDKTFKLLIYLNTRKVAKTNETKRIEEELIKVCINKSIMDIIKKSVFQI